MTNVVRILVVCISEDARQRLIQDLSGSSRPIQPVLCPSPDQAEAMVAGGQADTVLVDMDEPGGFAAAEAIRKAHPATPVVLLATRVDNAKVAIPVSVVLGYGANYVWKNRVRFRVR